LEGSGFEAVGGLRRGIGGAFFGGGTGGGFFGGANNIRPFDDEDDNDNDDVEGEC
jgi:hypothetical protein